MRFTQYGMVQRLHDKVESGLIVKTPQHIRQNCSLEQFVLGLRTVLIRIDSKSEMEHCDRA